MKNLIIYSTRKGSTRKMAELLAKGLKGKTTIANIKEKPSVEGYDNVIMGGAVIAGQVRNGIGDFAQEHLEALRKKNIALFVCCLQEKKEEIWDYFAKTFPGELVKQSVACESIGYAFYPEKEKFLMRMMSKLMKAKRGFVAREENINRLVRAVNSQK